MTFFYGGCQYNNAENTNISLPSCFSPICSGIFLPGPLCPDEISPLVLQKNLPNCQEIYPNGCGDSALKCSYLPLPVGRPRAYFPPALDSFLPCGFQKVLRHRHKTRPSFEFHIVHACSKFE
ncbi:unnamed protein product [Clavelina lepadiformis]|uniref:Uncharacterized protein n=1 Tax=Clavelina lepadiformis TaxID=159417 RepID=A0ABP0GYU8_CLALP